jgi:hypothetical protein
MIAALKFASGFASNALTQTARCLWNLVVCVVQAALSLLYAALAAGQFAGGGAKQSRKTIRFMVASARLSLRCGMVCLAQGAGVLTCASPLMRASQACSEGISPRGVFLPCGSGRSLAQRILGLNSWEDDNKSEATLVEVSHDPKAATENDRAAATQKKDDALADEANPRLTKIAAPSKHDHAKTTRKIDDRSSWESLVEQYLAARTIKDTDRIRNKMASDHTRKYIRALRAASKPGKRSA